MREKQPLPFSSVFVINLRRCTKRWASAKGQLERSGVKEVTRWEAFDGEKLDDVVIGRLQREGVLSTDLGHFSESARKGEIGCALSHAALLEHIAEKKIPRALILEDDFEIPGPVGTWSDRIGAAFADLPSDFDVWFLFRCFDVRRKAKRITPRTVIPFTPLCATAYCVTPRGAGKLLRAAKPLRKAIDRTYVEDMVRKRRAVVFAASPPLVLPGGHRSIINAENTDKAWIDGGVNRPPEYWPDHFKEGKNPFARFVYLTAPWVGRLSRKRIVSREDPPLRPMTPKRAAKDDAPKTGHVPRSSYERPPITFCMINRNGEQHFPMTLPALGEAISPSDELLLVDNASTDRSAEIFRSEFPRAKVISLPSNGGPAAARNAGFRAAANDGILFLDNDIALRPGTADRLHRSLHGDRHVLLTLPRVLYASSPDTIHFDGADSHFLGHMITRNTDCEVSTIPARTLPVGSMVSACFYIDRSRWNGGEPFDETFIFNYEDHDFGMRARAMGWTILCVPSAAVLHGDGTPGLSFRRGRPYPSRRVPHLLQGRWKVILKNYETRSLVLLFPALLLYEAILLFGSVMKGWSGVWWSSIRSVAEGRGRISNQRSALRSMRRAGDGTILRNGHIPLTKTIARSPVTAWMKPLIDLGFFLYGSAFLSFLSRRREEGSSGAGRWSVRKERT